MVDTCTDFYGDLPAIPQNILILIISACFVLWSRSLVYYVENFDAPPLNPKDATHTSYGLGAKVVVKMLSSLSLAFSLPTIVLWFIFSNMSDFNSQQFACQVQSGTPWIGPLATAWPVFLMIVTNYLRNITRHTYARVVSEYLKPANNGNTNAETNENGSEKVRIANLPAYRGIWVSPFAHIFEQNCKAMGITQDRIELITLDCFESVYNAESSAWLKANMVLEGLADRLQILWTDFSVLPLDSATVDVFMVPLGSVNAYLNGVPGEETTPEMKKKLTVHLVQECCRVLKPGGVLIASNMSMKGDSWAQALEEVGMSAEVLPTKVWWSFMPAAITVATKASKAGGGTNNSSISDGEGTMNVLHAAAAITTGEDVVIEPNTGSESVHGVMESLEFDNSNNKRRLSLSVGPTHVHSAKGCCPSGTHWTKINLLLLLSSAGYIGFVLLTWYTLTAAQLPYEMPYDQMVSALMVNNSVFIPVALYGMVGDLRRAAAFIDAVHGVDANAIIRKMFIKNMVNLLALLTLSTGLGWLPYFCLDLFLIKISNYTIDEVSEVNEYVSIAVIVVLIPILRTLYDLYQKREAEEEKERNRQQQVQEILDAQQQQEEVVEV